MIIEANEYLSKKVFEELSFGRLSDWKIEMYGNKPFKYGNIYLVQYVCSFE